MRGDSMRGDGMREEGALDAALPRAHGAPLLRARMRATPVDFEVEELDAFAPSGAGEHLLLTVEKRGMNTAYAASRIAAWAGVAESAIGYAGLKDRHALTRQRFSVWLPKKVAPDIATLAVDDAGRGESLRVLDAAWHSRKLPRGALAGNRFVLTLREVSAFENAANDGPADDLPARIAARLADIQAHGVPNYFGEQRFGRGGGNIPQALAMFAGRRVPPAQRTHLLSAARSALFNRVLAARVADGSWCTALDGEVWLLDGSRSVFGPEPFDDTLAARLAAFDIHPSGPLWGTGALRSEAAAQALELAALADDEALALRAGLERAGLRQERRALRLCAQQLQAEWCDAQTLRLRFSLPPGTYATVVLRELGDITTQDERD